jgi:DNA-binding NarL/FixJ family response regulator
MPERPRISKLLVVHEFPVVRAGMRAMLQARDLRVVGEAATVDEAIRLASTLTPDLVVLGSWVGKGDPFDLVRRIKARSPRISVIMMTASAGTRNLSRALAVGCSGYLDGHVLQQDLLKAVRAVVRGECILEPSVFQHLLREMAEQRVHWKVADKALLTVPERDVLHLIVEGQTNRQISGKLSYSVGTVKDYVQRIIRKLGVSDRTQAAVKAVRLDLLH